MKEIKLKPKEEAKKKEKEITLTIEQFAKANADVICKEPFDSIVKEHPHLFALLSMYGAKVCNELFKNKESEDKK